jgi:hypothetical protein
MSKSKEIKPEDIDVELYLHLQYGSEYLETVFNSYNMYSLPAGLFSDLTKVLTTLRFLEKRAKALSEN